MLFLVLFFLVISSVTVSFLRRNRQSALFMMLCISFCIMLIGVIIYLAKTGGLMTGQKFLLFFDTRLQRKLAYMVFPLKRLGYLVAVGRTLFPGFMLMVALETSQSYKIVKMKKYSAWTMLLPAVTLIMYIPQILLGIGKVSKQLQLFLINCTIGWMTIYLLISLALLLYEYRSITIPYCRKQYTCILVFLISLGIMYCFYYRQDPIQMYQMYSAEYMKYGGLLYSGTGGGAISRWVVFSILTTIFGAIGFWNMRTYTQMEREETKGDVMIQKKFDMASRGISVFVHGMKNQLLSNRILADKIKTELQKEQPDLDKLRQCSSQLYDINENMLKRMEELYQSIKSKGMKMHPTDAKTIVERAVTRFHEKYPDAEVQVQHGAESLVLADVSHLSEAIYNLLINGYEAILDVGAEEPWLGVTTKDERLFVSFEISDNGAGISKQTQKKIFDPFYTSKNTNNNWGMGLYYVREIVKSHMGILKLESTQGKGTRFYVAIPRYENRIKREDQA